LPPRREPVIELDASTDGLAPIPEVGLPVSFP
jgi:hypothetical protein